MAKMDFDPDVRKRPSDTQIEESKDWKTNGIRFVLPPAEMKTGSLYFGIAFVIFFIAISSIMLIQPITDTNQSGELLFFIILAIFFFGIPAYMIVAMLKSTRFGSNSRIIVLSKRTLTLMDLREQRRREYDWAAFDGFGSDSNVGGPHVNRQTVRKGHLLFFRHGSNRVEITTLKPVEAEWLVQRLNEVAAEYANG
ncbi:MAG: hypothetical protein AAFX39_14025 [Pseudomonadota bacterium]